MLQSKYLTQDGVTRFLRIIYDRGYNFVFRNPDKCEYTLSKKEPVFRGNTFLRCDGDYKFAKDDFSIDILKDLLDGRNYIKIDEHINVIDWSKVAVDTPILVKSDDECWYNRHFAKYEDGRIYAWRDGMTSWSLKSADDNIAFIYWQYAKLANKTKE